MFFFSIFLCGITSYFEVVQVCQFDNLKFLEVDQVVMCICAGLKIGYRVKSKVIKSKATTLNLKYTKQQPSKVQGRKMATKWNSM